MVKLTTVQAAHTYGVLDPHVIERRDTKFVAGSLADAENIVLLPAGGYQDRGGSTDYGRARRELATVTINGTILSLPNGGAESDLLNATGITVAGATGTRFVIFELDFGIATLVHFFDLQRIGIKTTPAAGAIIMEYWTGAAWAAFGAPAKITLSPYTRRIASGAPGHAGISATKFRLAINATTAAGDVSLGGVSALVETPVLSDALLRRYAPESGDAYHLIFTAGHVDIFEGPTWRASAPLTASAANLREIKLEPKFETIAIWHRTTRPQALRMLDSVTEWACDPITFTNMPRVDYGAVYTNGVNCEQRLALYNLSSGERFDLTVEGQTTASIIVGADETATAANIKAALEALPNIEAGMTVTHPGGGFNDIFTIEFTGDENAARDWLLISATALDTDGYVRVTKITTGKTAGEDMFSSLRGWPSVGRYAQQRLIMGGLPQNPNAFIASVTGSPFDLNTELDLATAAFSYEIDGSENTALHDIVVTNKLLFIGDQQIAFLKNNTLSASERPEFGLSDAPGIKREVAPIASDNAMFYVQNGGKSLRMVSYSEVDANFLGDNASVLSAHLIKNPVDMARRRARGAVDSDLLMLVNAEGSMTVLTLMRTQEISGFAPWRTQGGVAAVCTDHDNVGWVLVTRDYGGLEMRRERLEPDLFLDAAIEVALTDTDLVTGLSRFNGLSVWAVTQSEAFGPYTVSGGQITLPKILTAAVRVGFWSAPFADDPGVSLEQETGQRQARLKRINRAEISVVETTSLAIQCNDGPVFNLPLQSNAQTTTDMGPLAQPVTGRIEAEGMHGFNKTGRMRVTQTFPGRMTVRSVTKTIAA